MFFNQNLFNLDDYRKEIETSFFQKLNIDFFGCEIKNLMDLLMIFMKNELMIFMLMQIN